MHMKPNDPQQMITSAIVVIWHDCDPLPDPNANLQGMQDPASLALATSLFSGREGAPVVSSLDAPSAALKPMIAQDMAERGGGDPYVHHDRRPNALENSVRFRRGVVNL
jgi:hypothetical protein